MGVGGGEREELVKAHRKGRGGKERSWKKLEEELCNPEAPKT